jgi:hypothetical protein
MKPMALLTIIWLGGCGFYQAPPGPQADGTVPANSPYEAYLPKEAPLERNRVAHSSGFSIVCPPGWTTRTIPIEDFLKSSVADQFELEGPQSDKIKPRITIQRLGPDAQGQWENSLKPDHIGDEYTRTVFQGSPALARFLTGYGKSKAVRGAYQPWLSQSLKFKSHGQWFSLDFTMRNADKGEPYYRQPLQIIQDYFETFRFNPPGD